MSRHLPPSMRYTLHLLWLPRNAHLALAVSSHSLDFVNPHVHFIKKNGGFFFFFFWNQQSLMVCETVFIDDLVVNCTDSIDTRLSAWCSPLNLRHHSGAAFVCENSDVAEQSASCADYSPWIKLLEIIQCLCFQWNVAECCRHSLIRSLFLSLSLSLWFTPFLDMCVCVYVGLPVILAYLTELWPSLLDNYSKCVSLF